ncbi:MAG: 50S ribosomal protein L18 [Promethearchaeota archaeon]|nr:MAG: 50S ribosomal protein L18 [Candidatus Lokiarchaeota archaeon]
MATGPKYRVPFRRRREGKTNYHRRLKLIQSRRNRLVIRCSNKHTIVQVVQSKIEGDKMLSQAHSQQLAKQFDWNYNLGNLPSAYLTGYLCGLRAKKAGIDDAIVDVGILVHDNRVKAAVKGFLDVGINVPVDESWFFNDWEKRIKGVHIAEYAQKLKKENSTEYKKKFSAILKNKGDPTNIEKDFENLVIEMEKKV